MAGRTLLTQLLQLVDAHTRALGTPVANLFGAAKAVVNKTTSTFHQTWLALQVAGTPPKTVDDFYAAFIASKLQLRQQLETDTGIVTVTNGASEQRTFLLKGAVSLDQARTFRVSLSTGSSQGSFALFVDEKLVRSGADSLDVNVTLDAGLHVLEVLATARGLVVQVPVDLPVYASLDAPKAPVWQAATPGWLDASHGSPANQLSWFVDPRAGGWRVLRRELTDLNTITTVNDAAQGVFSCVITGDQTSALQVGATIYAGSEVMGTVQAVDYDSVNTVSNVTVALPPDEKLVSQFWVGRVASMGDFQEVHRISRTVTGGVQSWNDGDVVIGNSYQYALQSYGYFDPTAFSPLSDVRFVRAGDVTVPGPITFADSYPKVVDTLARVKFTAPSDTDYEGVRVIYRSQYTGGVASATATTLTATGTPFPATPPLTGYTVRITAGTGIGQERTVTANTTSQVTGDSAWLTNPDTTSEFVVFFDTPLVTNYGVPGILHAFTFEPHDANTTAPEQLYLFPTFDFAGNQQLDHDCAQWLYDPTSNGQSTVFATLTITLISSTATTIVLQVDATSPDGAPQVRWNFVNGTTSCTACTAPGGENLETLVASGTQWTFSRPTGSTPAQVGFEAVLAGVNGHAERFTIPQQGVGVTPLHCVATLVSDDLETMVVSVTANDPNTGGSTTPLTLHLDDTGGLAAGSVTPSADVTGTGSITQQYTIARPPFGNGVARVQWKVSSSDTTKLPAYDSIDVQPQTRDSQYCQCNAQITASDATTVTVTVTAQTNTGSAQVKFVGVSGSATLASGAAAGTFESQDGTHNVWVFNRGAINAGAGQAHFSAHLDGFEDDDAYATIEEQGRDTIILGIKARAITTAPDHVVVRVFAVDPHPQGANSVTLSYESQGTGAITPPSPLTLTPTSDYASTGYLDFTVYRPAFASGAGHFVVTASAANREPAVDSLVIPEVLQDTQPCVCKAAVTGYTKDTCTVTVTGTNPNGTPQVELVGVSGSATLSSGTAAGTLVNQDGTSNVWVFTRGGVDAGLGQAQFRAHFPGTSAIPTVDDDDYVEIADKGQDTRALTISLESVGTTSTTETVRVKVIDPNPQGANTVSIAYFANGVNGVTPASGQVLTPTADFSTTGFVDFTITRANIGSDQGTVKFLATCANRVPDADSCFVTAERQTTFGPSLDITLAMTTTAGTFTYTDTGTLTYSKNGAAATTPPVSPFSVSRPAAGSADDTYTFLCVKDGQTIQDSFTVTAIGNNVVTPDLKVSQTASAATSFTYQLIATNPGAGGAPIITVTPVGCTAHWGGTAYTTAFNPASGDSVSVDRPVFGSAPGSLQCRAAITGGGAETITLPIANQEDSQITECKARIVASDATTVTVECDATSPNGTPQVALIATTGSATVNTRPAGASPDGTFVASGGQWIFNRGGFQAGAGMAQFRAHLAGLVDNDDLCVLPEQGRDTIALDLTAHVVSETAATITVRVTVADPISQGTLYITLSVDVLTGCTMTQGGVSAPAGTTWTTSPGNTLDFLITRPNTGTGAGGVKWKVTAANRVADYATITVPEISQDNPGGLTAELSGSDVVVNFQGPSTCNSWRYASSTSSMPADSAADTGTIVTGRSARVTFTNELPTLGGHFYIKARQFSGSSGDGTGGPYNASDVERQNKSTDKTLYIAAEQFVPATDNLTGGWSQTGASLAPRLKGATLCWAWAVLPAGSTIHQVRAYMTRTNGLGAAFYLMYKYTASTYTNVVPQQNHSTTGAQILSYSLTESAGATPYIIEVELDTGVSTNAGDNFLNHIEIDYTAPDYTTAI